MIMTTISVSKPADPFAWLKDTTRKDPKVIAFLKEENERTERFLSDTKGLQKRLIKEFKSRIQGTYETYPFRIGQYLYYHRYEEGKDFPVVLRKRSLRAKPEVILDWNALAEGHDFFYPGGWEVSRDGRYLAFSYDVSGGENFALYVKDLRTGEVIDSIPKVSWGEFLWTRDNRLIYAVETEETKRPYRVLIHTLGEDVGKDGELFRDDNESYFVGIYSSLDGYVFASSGNTESNVTALIYPYRRDFYPRRKGLKYWVHHGDGKFYVLTNDGAENYRVLEVDERSGEEREIIPEERDVPIEDITVFKDFIALQERYEGLTAIRIYDRRTGRTHRVKFREAAYTVGLSGNHEYDTDSVRILYTSPTTPNSIYFYNVKTGKLRKRWQEPVPNYDPKRYRVVRLWARSYDGVRFPITLVYRKDRFRRDRKHPVLLTGYGAYGSPFDPYFNRYVISLLDRGFAYAIAHIRGGGEFGERWHREGKFLKKKNSIYDFVEAAEYLIVDGWADRGRIAITGASAGGIIVGGALNVKPYLFGVAVAVVPFVDVLNTMLDPNLPLTVPEYDEWGNPEDPKFYEYIRSYSPYDNVKPDSFPPVLATAGLHDPRVGYWEPAKWVLKLRQNNRANTPILLWTDLEAGHLGRAGRYRYMKEVAMRYAFILKVLKGKR